MRKPSSSSNDRSKRSKSNRGRGARNKANQGQNLWLYGLHAVSAALKNPSRDCHDLLMTPDAATRLAPTLESLAPGIIPSVREVGVADVEAVLPNGAVHQGIALRTGRLDPTFLEDACAPQSNCRNLVMVLDHVTDPQNVGAVLRSAAAFGARALVVTQSNAPAESGSLAKAASGALDILPYVQVTNLARALDQLAGLGYWRIGLAPQAESLLGELDLSGNVALVLGAVGSGLRRLTAIKSDTLARLPTQAGFPDLNVSNAAAVALYEIARPKT